SLRPWLVDIAERACLPLEMLAVPALVGLSGLVGRSVAVRPREYSDWTVTPNLWGGIVAPPGAKKSDAIAEALRPLAVLEAKARAAHQRAALEAKAERLALEARLAALKGQAKKGELSQGGFVDLLARLEALETVPERRYVTHDATAEKLGELLRDNPRGLVLVRDELASWLAAMELQEYAVARGFFLSAWNGNTAYTFDRIGRGTIHIPAACVAVVGAIQPRPLEAVFDRLRTDPTRADGMLQRFQLLVWPDGMPPWTPPQSWPDQKARERAFEVFARLDGLEFRDPEGRLEPHLLTLSEEAGRAFAQWHDAHERRLRDPKLANTPHFAAHVAKYGSLAASLATIFHLVELAGDDTRWVFDEERWSLAGELPPVGLGAVHLALDWVGFLEEHARKVYAPELNGAILDAHALAQQIEEGLITDGQTVREVQRTSRRWVERERLNAALALLERLNWLRVVEVEPGPLGGRPSEVVRLHPELREEQK
ncbi:YfjI family protein, partial [Paenibacillus sp. MDMC362]|uniref:YfjI family protein n=3 Tax=Bacteria TaxID=2 RepID=UPI000DC218B2